MNQLDPIIGHSKINKEEIKRYFFGHYFSGEFTQKTSWHRICIFKPGLVDIVYTYCKKG